MSLRRPKPPIKRGSAPEEEEEEEVVEEEEQQQQQKQQQHCPHCGFLLPRANTTMRSGCHELVSSAIMCISLWKIDYKAIYE